MILCQRKSRSIKPKAVLVLAQPNCLRGGQLSSQFRWDADRLTGLESLRIKGNGVFVLQQPAYHRGLNKF